MTHLLQYFPQLSLRPENLTELRGLILQLAVEGKLTAEWRKNHPEVEPATKLLARIEAEKAELVKAKKIKKSKTLPPVSEEEMPFKLPESWAWCRLGELCSKIGSGSTPKGGKKAYTDQGIVFFRSQNVYNDGLKLDGIAKIPIEIHEKMKNTKVFPEDILLNITGASIGRCSLVPSSFSEGNVSQHVSIIRLIESEYNQFVHNYIISPTFQAAIMAVQVGVSREGLSITNLKKLPVPIPTLPEQKAIVQTVGALLQELDQLQQRSEARLQLKADYATAALRRLTTASAGLPEALSPHFHTFFNETGNVQSLRAAILQLAVQGKLTAQWRKAHPDVEPATELLSRIQLEKAELVKAKKIRKEKPLPPVSAVEVSFDLPEGWVWCRLGSVAISMNNGLYKPKKFYSDSGIISLRMYNIQEGKINFKKPRRVELSQEELEQYSLESNDLLINRVNSSELIGKSAIIPKFDEDLVYESMNVRVRLCQKEELASYINLLLQSEYARNYFVTNAKQAIGQASINQNTIGMMDIPLPPLPEQQAIVQSVEELLGLCTALEDAAARREAVLGEWVRAVASNI